MTTHLGRFFSLLLPIIIVLNVLIVLSRYVFGVGLVAFQELVLYLHAIIFLGCAGWVLLKDEHVRVDIFYRGLSGSYKNNVNFLLSFFFLLPVCFVIGFYSIELIEMSWKIREVSTEAGGLAYVYIQKTLLILFPLTMILTFAYQLIYKKWK